MITHAEVHGWFRFLWRLYLQLFSGDLKMVDQREKEMAEMRARYAKLRGKKVDDQPSQKLIEEKKEVVIEVKPTKKQNPYIRLIKNDIGNLISSIKKLLGVKEKQKPLNLTWLEKNDGKFWKWFIPFPALQ